MSKQRINDQESRKRNKPQSLIPYAQKQDKEEKLFMMSDEMAAYHKSKQEKKDNRITGTEWFKRKMKPKPETETATTQETEEEQVEEVVQEQEITNSTNNGGSSSPSANSRKTEEIDRSSLKGGLYDISKALGPAYDYKKLQKEWFPTGTDFSELWPNLIIEYYLKQVGWKTSDPAPYVKHTFIGGRLVILSTFAGKIGEGHIDSITAFNYIALKGLKGTAKAGFHLLNSESDFSSSAGTGVITGGRAIGYEFKPTEQDKINDQSEASFYQELSSDRDLLTSDLFSSEAISATHDQLAKDYYDYWDLYPQKLDRVEHSGTGTPIYRSAPESTIAKVEQKRIDLENKLKANGYQSIDEFGAFLAVISKRHQDATVRLANGILDNYEQKIKEKEEKFKDENYVQGLYNSLQGVIKLNRNKATVDNYNKMPTKTYSEYLAKDAHSQYIPQAEKNIEEITPQANAETENIRKNYPELDENDIEKLFPQLSVVRDLDDFKRVLKEYIKEKKDNIQTTRDRLVDDPGSVYKMDALLALSKDALGVKKDSTSDLVINRAQKRRVAEDII